MNSVALGRFVVGAGWLLFGALFLWSLRGWKRGGATVRRSGRGRLGLLLQGAGAALLFAAQRPGHDLQHGFRLDLDLLLAGLALLLMGASSGFVLSAVRTLGRQWALDARVTEKHVLITEGPYAHVRHPIYAGMGGMVLATGIVLSAWWALIAGMGLYAAGTVIRYRAEETVLRGAFGQAYEAYRTRVPAVVPWRRAKRSPDHVASTAHTL